MRLSVCRIVIVVCLCLLAVGVSGQEYKKPGYESTVRLLYDIGVYGNYMSGSSMELPYSYGKHKNDSYGVEYIARYRKNDRYSYGVGVGVYCIDLCIEPMLYKMDYEEGYGNWRVVVSGRSEKIISFPMFFDWKYSFIRGMFSPYIEIGLGSQVYWIGLSEILRKRSSYNTMTFFARPEIGLDIRFDRCTVLFGVAYKFQHREYESDVLGMKLSGYHQISVVTGIEF